MAGRLIINDTILELGNDLTFSSDNEKLARFINERLPETIKPSDGNPAVFILKYAAELTGGQPIYPPAEDLKGLVL